MEKVGIWNTFEILRVCGILTRNVILQTSFSEKIKSIKKSNGTSINCSQKLVEWEL